MMNFGKMFILSSSPFFRKSGGEYHYLYLAVLTHVWIIEFFLHAEWQASWHSVWHPRR
jgi:hypothetical protein